MSKMYGPDQNVLLRVAGSHFHAPTRSLTLSQLYKIIYDRLDYARFTTPDATGIVYPVSQGCDIEAVTQQAMVELRKKLGLYKEDV